MDFGEGNLGKSHGMSQWERSRVGFLWKMIKNIFSWRVFCSLLLHLFKSKFSHIIIIFYPLSKSQKHASSLYT